MLSLLLRVCAHCMHNELLFDYLVISYVYIKFNRTIDLLS